MRKRSLMNLIALFSDTNPIGILVLNVMAPRTMKDRSQLLCKSVCYYTYPRAFFPRLYQPLLAILMGEVRHLVKMCPLQRMQSCLELYYNCLEETFFQSCTVFEYVQKWTAQVKLFKFELILAKSCWTIEVLNLLIVKDFPRIDPHSF